VKQQRFWWKNCARKSVKKGFFYSVNGCIVSEKFCARHLA